MSICGSTATSVEDPCASSPRTLDEQLSAGARRVVLDNTYLTRASRSYVIETANRHRAEVRCIWLDTPLAQAQVNLVERLLDRFGTLPSPEKIHQLARREPGVLTPTSQMRALPRARAAVDGRGIRGGRHGSLRARAFANCESRVASSRPPRWGSPVGSTPSGSSTAMRLTWSSTGALAATTAELARVATRLSAELSGAGRERTVLARRRPADLLVPTSAPRPAARVRAGARRGPVSFDSRGHLARAPNARDDARCAPLSAVRA